MAFLVYLISIIFNVLTLLVLAQVILSYFMQPYHPVRQLIDRLVEPMLMPIRRIMPRTGMLDFSPMILLILLQILERVLISVLIRL